jgi:hypothetical protein
LGGVLTQELSGQWIFLVNGPIGAVAVRLALSCPTAGSGDFVNIPIGGVRYFRNERTQPV